MQKKFHLLYEVMLEDDLQTVLVDLQKGLKSKEHRELIKHLSK